jgi:hypothetical protein
MATFSRMIYVILHHSEQELCQLSVHVSVMMAYPSNVPSVCYIIKSVLSYLFLFLWQIIREEGD